ncbi:hypothetical protein CJF30_00009310 [Rutstroemia sp. NJR-2017a BBW]|nr:hypothetical protein CJF30_00009310 [Rutstroemia sp. NJR-2017a BBW]
MGLGPTARDYLVSAIGEFVGTYLFLFFAFAATQTANQPNGTVPPTANATNTSVLLYIALGFGASLAANVWVFFRVSGGQFNPAVTFALVLIGAVPPVKAALLIPIQLLAGTFAALSARAVIPGKDILFAVSLGPGVTPVQGLFIEMLLTFMLIITILMLVAEKTKSTFVAPIGIGFSLFIGHLVGIFWTGAGINPARAFSPALASLSFPTYHWLYWLGPALGAILAAGLYLGLKAMDYELVGGDADKEKSEGKLSMKQADLILETLRGLPVVLRGDYGSGSPRIERRDWWRLSGMDPYMMNEKKVRYTTDEESGESGHMESVPEAFDWGKVRRSNFGPNGVGGSRKWVR